MVKHKALIKKAISIIASGYFLPDPCLLHLCFHKNISLTIALENYACLPLDVLITRKQDGCMGCNKNRKLHIHNPFAKKGKLKGI